MSNRLAPISFLLRGVERWSIRVAAVMLGLVISQSAIAQSSTLTTPAGERLNAAAMQRMLSQRIAKAYAQQVVGVMTPQATEVLNSSVTRFNTNLAMLRSAGLPGDASRALADLERAAAPLLATATTPPARERLETIQKASDETLAAAEALVKAMPSSGATGANLIALAGRQRMLSQRAAKQFFMYQAGPKSPEVRASFERAIKDFESVLAEFKAQSEEFPEVRDEVELAGVQMEFFKTAARSLDGVSDSQKATVARSSERLLETMESLTKEMAMKFVARETAAVSPQAQKKAR